MPRLDCGRAGTKIRAVDSGLVEPGRCGMQAFEMSVLAALPWLGITCSTFVHEAAINISLSHPVKWRVTFLSSLSPHDNSSIALRLNCKIQISYPRCRAP